MNLKEQINKCHLEQIVTLSYSRRVSHGQTRAINENYQLPSKNKGPHYQQSLKKRSSYYQLPLKKKLLLNNKKTTISSIVIGLIPLIYLPI